VRTFFLPQKLHAAGRNQSSGAANNTHTNHRVILRPSPNGKLWALHTTPKARLRFLVFSIAINAEKS
jgi:hypothetical protein